MLVSINNNNTFYQVHIDIQSKYIIARSIQLANVTLDNRTKYYFKGSLYLALSLVNVVSIAQLIQNLKISSFLQNVSKSDRIVITIVCRGKIQFLEFFKKLQLLESFVYSKPALSSLSSDSQYYLLLTYNYLLLTAKAVLSGLTQTSYQSIPLTIIVSIHSVLSYC